MVTIQEARTQLQSRQQELSNVQRQIEQAQLERIPRAELQIRRREDIIARKLQEGVLQTQKAEAMKSLKPIEAQLKEADKVITQAEAEDAARARFQDILSRIARGRPIPPGTTPFEVARAEKILEPFISRSVAEVQTLKTLSQLKAQGLKPIIKEGEVIGFEDLIGKQSIRIEDLDIIGDKRVQALVKQGIIKFEDVPVVKEVRIDPRTEKVIKEEKKTFFKRIFPKIPLFAGVPAGSIELDKVTKGIFKGLEGEGFSKEKMAEIITQPGLAEIVDTKFPFLSKKQRDFLKRLKEDEKDIIVGGLKGFEEEPQKTIIVGGASFLFPGLIKAGASIPIISKLLKGVPTSVKRKGAKAIQVALGGLYATSVGLQISKGETRKERAEIAGRILTTEVIPFAIGTRAGVQSLLRTELKNELSIVLAKMSPKRRQAFIDYMKQAEILGKYEPKGKNIELDNIKSIKDSKAQTAIRNWLKANKGEVIVGGSVAQTGQIKVGRRLGDMDLYLETKNPIKTARDLANILKRAGVQRVSNIGRQITIEGKKAIEFHEIDRLLINIKQVIPNWQSPRRYIMRTPEGIQIQRIGLQVRRKVVASFADPRRLATGKYRQDLQDFKKISEQLFRNAELNARRAFFFREKKIRALEKLFRVKVSRVVPLPKGVKPVKIPKGEIVIPKRLPKRFRIKKVKKIKVEKFKPSQPSQLKPKKVKSIIASQIKAIKKKAPTIIPSQPPIKPKKKFAPPITNLPKIVPPSQLPVKTPLKDFIIPSLPPSQPPIKPRKPKIVPPTKLTPTQKVLANAIRALNIKNKQQLYDVFIKKRMKVGKKKFTRGRFVKIADDLPINLAKKRGADFTDRNLGATFKIQKDKFLVTSKSISKGNRDLIKAMGITLRNKIKPDIPSFSPSKVIFRDFKIRKGKRIPLTNTWIEVRRKRLSTPTEVSQLQAARKKGITFPAGFFPKSKPKKRKRKNE